MHSEPVVKFTNLLLLTCFREEADSITLEPRKEGFHVSYTVNGVTHELTAPEPDVGRAVCDRLWLASYEGKRVGID